MALKEAGCACILGLETSPCFRQPTIGSTEWVLECESHCGAFVRLSVLYCK